MYPDAAAQSFEDRVVRVLNQLPLVAYLIDCRTNGRKNIDPLNRKRARDLYGAVADWRQIWRPQSPELSNALAYGTDFLWAEHFLATNDRARYVPYTNMRILDRYLLVGRQEPVEKILKRCREAIALLVRDWLDFEEEAAFNHQINAYKSINYQNDRVLERVKALKELRDLTPYTEALPHVHSLYAIPPHQYQSDWLYYGNAGNGAIAMLHITGLPQSQYHDEYMFLRTIHIAECCFWGAITSIRCALEHFRQAEVEQVTRFLNEASSFTGTLVKLFAIFETMPVESFFHGFREATGDASAIQSHKYQYLDLLARGYNEQKTQALSQKPELTHLAKLSTFEPNNLATLADKVRGDPRASEVHDAIARIDRHLVAWRSKHVGIAVRYLPPEHQGQGDGTGGEGVPYLKSNVRDPLIMVETTDSRDEGTEVVHLTPGFQIAATSCHIGWLEFADLSVDALVAHLDATQKHVGSELKKSREAVAQRIEHYQTFFAARGFQSPLSQQFDKGLPSKTAPLVPRLLLRLELATGLLMGMHDATKIAGTPVLDIASAGEIYTSISGRSLVCRDREWVFRDKKGIFASYFQGPDKRTALPAAPAGILKKVAIPVLGAPGIVESEFAEALSRIKSELSTVAHFESESKWAL